MLHIHHTSASDWKDKIHSDFSEELNKIIIDITRVGRLWLREWSGLI